MKIKQRPEDFSVVESYRFEPSTSGEFYVYRMDKQKLGTLDAVERLRTVFGVKRRDVSFCGLKDKQGRTEQLIAVRGRAVDLQDPDLKLTFLGRSSEPLSAKNIASNRFSVIVRDLSQADVERLPEAVAEVARVGVVNYFDSQRFGFVKHGQGYIAKDLLRGDLEAALKSLIAKPSELDKSDDAKVKAWFAQNWGEWHLRPPTDAGAKYFPMLLSLRHDPRDFGKALLKLDRRMRAMVIFEYQSALWNESVKRWIAAQVKRGDLVNVRYQLGGLDFPRAVPPGLKDSWATKTFPLLGPDTTFDDPLIQKACVEVLREQKLSLERLVVTKLPAFHFAHEERPLVVFPGKLHASEGKPDEANPGRQKVVLSFTLPPGAYATLVVRRVLWFATTEHREEQKPVRVPRPAPTPAEPAAPKEPRKGFLERQREKKTARQTNRTAATATPTKAKAARTAAPKKAAGPRGKGAATKAPRDGGRGV